MWNAAPDLSFLSLEVLYPVFGYMSLCTMKKKINNLCVRERERERERGDRLPVGNVSVLQMQDYHCPHNNQLTLSN